MEIILKFMLAIVAAELVFQIKKKYKIPLMEMIFVFLSGAVISVL